MAKFEIKAYHATCPAPTRVPDGKGGIDAGEGDVYCKRIQDFCTHLLSRQDAKTVSEPLRVSRGWVEQQIKTRCIEELPEILGEAGIEVKDEGGE